MGRVVIKELEDVAPWSWSGDGSVSTIYAVARNLPLCLDEARVYRSYSRHAERKFMCRIAMGSSEFIGRGSAPAEALANSRRQLLGMLSKLLERDPYLSRGARARAEVRLRPHQRGSRSRGTSGGRWP